MIRQLLVSALLAGGLAGLTAGAVQLVFVQPILQQAELYEAGTLVLAGGGEITTSGIDRDVDLVRIVLLLAFSVVIYVGFAMILASAMALAQNRGVAMDSRSGLLWGVAGFVAVHMAPGFSLAPELPGVAAADVYHRQLWWAATVAAAGVALWLIAFRRSWPIVAAAAALLLLPHLVGAPEPEEVSGLVPAELAAVFATRSLGTALVAWVVLGCVAGALSWRQSKNEGRIITR